MIEKITPSRTSSEGVTVEFAPRFLSAPFGRKLYVVEDGHRFRIPSSGRVHVHASPDYLVPLSGEILLAYRKPNGKAETLRLEAGYHYRIPPYLPHQVEIRGGVLESFYPSAAYEKGLPTREADEDLFAELEGSERGGNSK